MLSAHWRSGGRFRVDLGLRMGGGGSYLQACAGPFWAVHAPARAFSEGLLPEGSILQRRRRELSVGVGPGMVPEGLCDQFQPPRPAGLPILSRMLVYSANLDCAPAERRRRGARRKVVSGAWRKYSARTPASSSSMVRIWMRG